MNETECDELIEKEALEESLSTTTESIHNSSSINTSNSTYSTEITKIETISTMQIPHKIQYNNGTRNHTIHKIQSDVCECDLTVSLYVFEYLSLI